MPLDSIFTEARNDKDLYRELKYHKINERERERGGGRKKERERAGEKDGLTDIQRQGEDIDRYIER